MTPVSSTSGLLSWVQTNNVDCDVTYEVWLKLPTDMLPAEKRNVGCENSELTPVPVSFGHVRPDPRRRLKNRLS
ncbi:unnamed protein product [Protopolystoma xenopodis]|uniref:Uncharacterized protein n=1 Tax=Protopolystoma xenopodis TaxID=117903 RepID=A0A3S5C781_9PLAT|nr:unnamed protein product [Protopolystoma xenopodis]